MKILAVVSLIALTACSSSTSELPRPTSTLLDQQAGDCPLGTTGGVTVTFAATTIPDGISVNRTGLCTLAAQASARQKETTRNQLEALCRTYSPLRRSLGTNDFEVAAQTLQNSVAEPDAATKQAISIFHECANKDAAVEMANSGISIKIYSVGSLKSLAAPGSTCLGYLEEMSGMKEVGGSTSYFLFGTGECTKQDYQNKELSFHPEANPSGKPPGDVMRNLYAYTGPLPKQWVYKGQTYPFGGQQVASLNILNARSNETMMAQEEGKSERSPKGAAQTADELADQQELVDQRAISAKCNASPSAQRQCHIEWCRERGIPDNECGVDDSAAASTPPALPVRPTPVSHTNIKGHYREDGLYVYEDGTVTNGPTAPRPIYNQSSSSHSTNPACAMLSNLRERAANSGLPEYARARQMETFQNNMTQMGCF